MDKKNLTLGAIMLIAAIAVMIYGSKSTPPAPSAPGATQAEPSVPGATATPEAPQPGASTPAAPASTANATFAPLATEQNGARVITLANDFVEIRLTDFGGAIKDVALRKYPAVKGDPAPLVLNAAHADPMLAFTRETFPGLDRTVRYEVVSQTDREVVFRAVFENRIEVTRRYTLPPTNVSNKEGDPYQVRHETTFRNLGDQLTPLPNFSLSIGTSAPLNAADAGLNIATGYNTGEDIDFIARGDLEGGGFLSMFGIGSRQPIPSIETSSPIVWGSVENQFFATILTPDQPGKALTTRRVELPPFAGTTQPVIGVTGAVNFAVPALAPGAETTLGINLYAGPKEYKRLSNADVFKQDQDKVMQFGMFKFFSQILLTIMTAVHSWGPSWGWSIVITTLFLKTIFLPLTLAASKSAKRMQKIQPEIQAIREKYKDNPQKMNQATMELFKEKRVNPAGGCFPILVTIPFFIGFFSMLQSTAELRFAEFLWANDLSAPDTVARIFGLPLNILPILMGATMVIQMHLTPQPTVDNMQMKMMRFMPYIFALFCYNFSCALALYSTVNGLFSIGQQLVINRMKDAPEKPAPAPVKRGGKPIKNVTPRK